MSSDFNPIDQQQYALKQLNEIKKLLMIRALYKHQTDPKSKDEISNLQKMIINILLDIVQKQNENIAIPGTVNNQDKP